MPFLTSGALLSRWMNVNDFSRPTYPTGPADFKSLLSEAIEQSGNAQGDLVDFREKVVLISGAGSK
jgi:multifunctional beta-oxidation protein